MDSIMKLWKIVESVGGSGITGNVIKILAGLVVLYVMFAWQRKKEEIARKQTDEEYQRRAGEIAPENSEIQDQVNQSSSEGDDFLD